MADVAEVLVRDRVQRHDDSLGTLLGGGEPLTPGLDAILGGDSADDDADDETNVIELASWAAQANRAMSES